MTYLEIVNQVLILMRLDEVDTLEGIEDEAVKVVKQNVNDAKRKVEQAWRWTALREYINVETVQGQANYVVPGTQEQMTIECVLNTTNNYYVRNNLPREIKRKQNPSPNSQGMPLEYGINGVSPTKEVAFILYPTPDKVYNIEWSVWIEQPALSADDDLLKVPYLPVVYEALAMSARERGEVGGQTALEIFGMAKNYLRDAVALDASMNPIETTWVAV